MVWIDEAVLQVDVVVPQLKNGVRTSRGTERNDDVAQHMLPFCDADARADDAGDLLEGEYPLTRARLFACGHIRDEGHALNKLVLARPV